MKGDIGMANYEKHVEQEAAYPIPISLYNYYRTVRHEKRYQEYIYSYASLLMPHCPEILTRDVGMEKNDRLGMMHTSDHRRSVWYKN